MRILVLGATEFVGRGRPRDPAAPTTVAETWSWMRSTSERIERRTVGLDRDVERGFLRR